MVSALGFEPGKTMRTVTLEPYEFERARLIGLERAHRFGQNGHREDYQHALESRPHDFVDKETANVNGALVEIASAKLLGLYWHGHGGILDRNKRYRFDADVGDWLECKHVLSTDSGPPIHQKDIDDALYRKQHNGPPLYVMAGHVRGAQVDLYGMAPVLDYYQRPCPDCKQHATYLRICQKHLELPESTPT